jgi:hypothetical protein
MIADMASQLPDGAHDPASGRSALMLVRVALKRLRPDLAATVLITALADVAKMIPADRRDQFAEACKTILDNEMLKARE